MNSAKQLVEKIYSDTSFAERIAPDMFPVSINHQQGIFLSGLVDVYKPSRAVELGFRYGVSSLWIQSARHVPATHVIVDPYCHVPAPPTSLILENYMKKRKGVIFEERVTSQEYLARVVSKGRHIDMVFIDASQWFDSVMTDMYFTSRILKIGGVVIIRNLYNRPVRKAVMFYLRNHSFALDGVAPWKNWIVKRVPIIGELLLRYIQRPVGLCVLRLTGEDDRVTKDLWRHFVSF